MQSIKIKTTIILLIMAFLGGASAYIISVIRGAEPAPQHGLYDGIELDVKLLQLDKRALDEAYHQQLLKLWGVWLVEGAKDATHFRNGLRNTRRAYGEAKTAIDKREQEIHKENP